LEDSRDFLRRGGVWPVFFVCYAVFEIEIERGVGFVAG